MSMDTPLYFLASALLFFAYVLRSAIGDISVFRINVFSSHVYIWLVPALLGVIFAYFGLADSHYILNRVSQSSIVDGVEMMAWSILGISIGMIFMIYFGFSVGRVDAMRWWEAQMDSPPTGQPRWYVIMVIPLAVLCIGLHVHYGKPPFWAISAAMSESATAAYDRASIGQSIGLVAYVKNLSHPLFLYVTYYLLANCVHRRQLRGQSSVNIRESLVKRFLGSRIGIDVPVVTSVATCMAMLMISNETAPILMFMFTFFVVARFSAGRSVSSPILLSVLFGIMSFAVFMKGTSMALILDRALFTQISGYFVAIDNYSAPIGISTMPTWIQAVCGESNPIQTTYARELMYIVNPKGMSNGTAGVVNSYFTTEIYMTLGRGWIVPASIWVGVILMYANAVIVRMPKNPNNIAIFGLLLAYFPLTGGFLAFVWNPSLIVVILMWFISDRLWRTRKNAA